MQLLRSGNKSASGEPPPSVQPLDQCACEILDVVPPVTRAIRKMMRQHRLAGLSVPQFRALGLLSFSPQASLSCVADYIGSSLPAASRMIDGLVSKKLVGRKECCHDRRQISLVLTSLGRSAFIESRRAAQRQLSERLTGLSENKKKCVIEAMGYLGEIFGSDADNLPPDIASVTKNIPERA
jgi:DNA-binding MarR family transcriptional regulator